MKHKIIFNYFKQLSIALLILGVFEISGLSKGALALEDSQMLTLKQTIDLALKANIDIQNAQIANKSAKEQILTSRTAFLPTFTSTYKYTHYNEEKKTEFAIGTYTYESLIIPENSYSFILTLSQPVFTGFANLTNYQLAKLGLSASQYSEKLNRMMVINASRNAYFSLLKAQKLIEIAKEAVTQLEAHEGVAKNFYNVGMIPLNDLLKAQVELANARQEKIVAKNSLDIAESNFNKLLRRHINASVEIEDILDYTPFAYDIDFCLESAQTNRLEIKLADIEVESAKKQVTLAKKDYYPAINLQGNYIWNGSRADLRGDEINSYPELWYVEATASWNFWEWGRTYHQVNDKEYALQQAKLRKIDTLDNIQLEVKQVFLKTKEAEENIITAQKVIEQAKENFRISEERYKEQMATSTDVLDARTLLSRAMSNYYNALYDFKISKSALYTAMGQEMLE